MPEGLKVAPTTNVTMTRLAVTLFACLVLGACAGAQQPAVTASAPSDAQFDLLIENGWIYDGSGGAPFRAEIAINDDRIAAIGENLGTSRLKIDAGGMAVAPGFINMLSWSTTSLIRDGNAQSTIRQGVTLEVMGEGFSMGPLNEEMKVEFVERMGNQDFAIEWTTLGEYLEYLENRGISTNVASFVGATTVRIHEVGYDDRPPAPAELEHMKALVAQAMEEGAMGLGTSLIYAPAFYSDTAELIELSRVASRYGGRYISHMRSEGNRLLEAVDELITIAREAGIGAEIYHLKAAGRNNWNKLDEVFARVEAAQAEGLDITADMYTYTAGSTGLDAAMPPWVQEGGHEAWVERLKDPAIRARVVREMSEETDAWESLYLAAGGPENILLVGFLNEELRPLSGKTLAEVAAMRGTSPEDTAIDLVIEDDSRVETVYFLMSEENVRRSIVRPWVAFGSDAESMAPEGKFLDTLPHPRTYGTFARLLGKYVRDEKIISLPEAIRRLTQFPAANLRLHDRGALKPGYFADIVVFDPAAIQDHATFEQPHAYSTGVEHVLVNGVLVLWKGRHTGAYPGRVIRGPGWRGTAPAGGGEP